MKAAATPSGTSILLALCAFTIDATIEDVREREEAIYDPNSYVAAQSLGDQLYTDGSAGVLYRNVRRSNGLCVGIFRPTVITNMAKEDDWRLIWDRDDVSEVLRVA